MAASTALGGEERREIYLDRRVCLVTPDRIELHPARSIIFLPLFTLAVGLSAFPVIFFWGDSLSIALRLLLTLAAILVVPASGIGLVYCIAGAHIVADRKKQTIVMQQAYLGMGVGTQELVPFYKVDYLAVKELTPHDWRGHQDDFRQYEVSIMKLSGRELSVGIVTVAGVDAADGLARAREVASLLADMSGTQVRVTLAPEKDAA